jgi:hypothetical protein
VPLPARNGNAEASPTLPLAESLDLSFSYNVIIEIPVYIMIATVVTRAFEIA